VVDVRNGSCIECLPPESVVEVPCRVDARGAHPLDLEPPQACIRGLMQQVKAYEELAVEAAVTRSRRTSVMALTNHPLVADADLASALIDEVASVHGIEFGED
jgi:6-phospho-beta-glucosidase